jgi:hypothetical protein
MNLKDTQYFFSNLLSHCHLIGEFCAYRLATHRLRSETARDQDAILIIKMPHETENLVDIHSLGIRLMALIGRRTRTVRIAERFKFSALMAYSTALKYTTRKTKENKN